jgi:hypothetical protein
MRPSTYKPQPEHDPWRRLMAKVIERAVLDLCSTRQDDLELFAAASFLSDTGVHSLCDAWGLWLPWTKIKHLAATKINQHQ